MYIKENHFNLIDQIFTFIFNLFQQNPHLLQNLQEQQHSSTKLKNTTTKTLRKLKKHTTTSPKLPHQSIPQSIFFLRPAHTNPPHNLSSASISNPRSLASSSFTSNDCSYQSPYPLVNNTSYHISTICKRPSTFLSSPSHSSAHLTLVDVEPPHTINIAISLGIQRLIALDSQKQQNHITSKYCYTYDSPFHSSDSDRYAPFNPAPHTPQTHVSTTFSNSLCIQSPPITEISIPCIPNHHLLDSPS